MRGPSTPRDARPFTTDAYPERVTDEDVRLIGLALLSAAADMASMGHEGPAGLASYVDPASMPSWHARFVLDMVAGTQGFPDPSKDAALDRLHGFVWQAGIMHALAYAATTDADLDLISAAVER